MLSTPSDVGTAQELLTISSNCPYNRCTIAVRVEEEDIIMAVFKDSEELQTCMGQLYDEAKRDSRIAPKIKTSTDVMRSSP